MADPRERYLYDPTFKTLADVLYHIIEANEANSDVPSFTIHEWRDAWTVALERFYAHRIIPIFPRRDLDG